MVPHKKMQDFHVIESVSVHGIDLAASARRWLHGARQAVWETSLAAFRLNWRSEVTVSILFYLKTQRLVMHQLNAHLLQFRRKIKIAV